MDVAGHRVGLLRQWKDKAVSSALRDLSDGSPRLRLGAHIFELDEADQEFLLSLMLKEAETAEAVTLKLIQAAEQDLSSFRSAKNWPAHTLDLKLSMSTDNEDLPITSAQIAAGVCTVETINLISDPGTGKTTTLVQLGERLVEAGSIVPALVPLGEWSDTSQDFFAFLCGRYAFAAFRPQHFMQAAFNGQLALLLDGWNELSGTDARRAIYLLEQLQREYPLLGLVFSSRARELPFSGAAVKIYPLSQDQQLVPARRKQSGRWCSRSPSNSALLPVSPLFSSFHQTTKHPGSAAHVSCHGHCSVNFFR